MSSRPDEMAASADKCSSSSTGGCCRAPWARWLFIAFCSMAVVSYAWLLWTKEGVCAGGADSSGYVNNAKLLLAGRLDAPQRCLEGLPAEKLPGYSYIPLGFMPTEQDRMVPTYALGLSAVFAGASKLMSFDQGMKVSMWLMGLASLYVMYRLARHAGLETPWSVLCVAALGFCPLFLFMSVQAMSDMPALLWTTLALCLAWGSRERAWQALAAGLVVALAVFTRPTNALVLFPLAFALGLSWRRWLLLGLGGFPGGVLWLMTNKALFGKYLATGYGDVGELFVWSNVPLSLANYGTWMPLLLPVLPFALVPVFRLRRSPVPSFVLMCASWVLLCFGFYAFYQYTSETWWYLRFTLPAFPALIVLGVLGLRQAAEALRRSLGCLLGGALALALAFGILGLQGYMSVRKNVFNAGLDELVYRDACRWISEQIPSNAVLVTMQMSGAIVSNNPNPIVRWDSMREGSWPRVLASARAKGRPVYAVMYPFELEQNVLHERVPGRWTKVGAVRHVTFFRLDTETVNATP